MIVCEEPEVPDGSYVVGYDFNIHSTIEYHCEDGHILRGNAVRTCTKEGEWSGSTPICECKLLKAFERSQIPHSVVFLSDIDCGKVSSLLYGNVEYMNTTTYLGSQLAYSCVRNYKLNGVSRRTCTASKQWSDFSPKCEGIWYRVALE